MQVSYRHEEEDGLLKEKKMVMGLVNFPDEHSTNSEEYGRKQRDALKVKANDQGTGVDTTCIQDALLPYPYC